MMLNIDQRVNLLRYYEIDAYRICSFILESEPLAMAAAQHTLLQLLNDEAFFLKNNTDQTIHTKQLAKKAAIQIHFTHLTTV